MRERDIERKLRQAVMAKGGWCLKWVSPGTTGVPDRIVVMPGHCPQAVELKAPGKAPTPLQAVVHSELEARGMLVTVIDSPSAVQAFVDGL